MLIKDEKLVFQIKLSLSSTNLTFFATVFIKPTNESEIYIAYCFYYFHCL
jgi:hypothetical protein